MPFLSYERYKSREFKNEISRYIIINGLLARVGNLITIGNGMAMSWPTAVLHKFYQKTSDSPMSRALTPNEIMWTSLIIFFGGIMGTLIAGPTIRTLGLKSSLTVSAIPGIVAWITISAASGSNVIFLIFGRILSGIVVGMGFYILPIYIADISQVVS